MRLAVRLQRHRELQNVLQARAAARDDRAGHGRIERRHQRRAIAAIQAVRHDRADAADIVLVDVAVVRGREIQFLVVKESRASIWRITESIGSGTIRIAFFRKFAWLIVAVVGDGPHT